MADKKDTKQEIEHPKEVIMTTAFTGLAPVTFYRLNAAKDRPNCCMYMSVDGHKVRAQRQSDGSYIAIE